MVVTRAVIDEWTYLRRASAGYQNVYGGGGALGHRVVSPGPQDWGTAAVEEGLGPRSGVRIKAMAAKAVAAVAVGRVRPGLFEALLLLPDPGSGAEGGRRAEEEEQTADRATTTMAAGGTGTGRCRSRSRATTGTCVAPTIGGASEAAEAGAMCTTALAAAILACVA